jgi:hypothetical protein
VSPLLAPNVAEIERAIDSLLQKNADGRVLAMRSPMDGRWPDAVDRGGRRFRIAWCPSELEVRERLDEVEENDSTRVVIVTPLDAATLSDDVIARFPHARIQQTDRWSALRGAFRARDVDPRLRTHKWLADLLLEHAPVRGYDPVAGGVLDLESAWRAALVDVLGLPDGRADVTALLDWSLDAAGLDHFVCLPEDARKAVADRIASEGGAAARLVLASAAAGRGPEALPFALVCGVVFGEPEPRQALREAAVRLEPFVGGARIDPEAARVLAEAGRRVFDRMTRAEAPAAWTIEARAAAILADIRADVAAALSPALLTGLEARLGGAATAIAHAAGTGNMDDAAAAWALVDRAVSHDRAGENRARVDRLRMAARLVRWLAGRTTTAWRNISEAAEDYAADGGFVDRARHAIRFGDQISTVAAAYARVGDAVTTKREEQNRAFAAILHEWNASVGQGEGPLPVERVLDTVIAPLARAAPVLLLVLDGLSFAVWRVLAETFARSGWTELIPAPRRGFLVAAAAIPSVTEVSRTSLLCGALTQGNQTTERAGFAAHTSLVAASSAGRPPRLFHKADLGAGPELGEEVRAAVSDPQQRIVGVVHNAVDAQLSGSDQLDPTWSADGLRQVMPLLHAARSAGRIIVVTGDHGHVLDGGTVQIEGSPGDRWRSNDAPPRDNEIALAGGRVLAASGVRKVVAAWSEHVRFSARRNGYHGGVSPQEVLIPIAVLAAGDIPSGWTEAPPPEPAWWRGEAPAPQVIAAAEPMPRPPRHRPTPKQGDLFASTEAIPTAPTSTTAAWLDSLFVSDSYIAQRRLAGRGAPPDEQVRRLLTAVAQRGGRVTRAGLSQALEMPLFRLAGLVSATRRVVNLDQAQILRDDGDDIILEETLLKAQFSLGGDK